MCCPSAYVLQVMNANDPGGAANGFCARSPWIGGDLQTLRNFLIGRRADLSAWPERSFELAMDDGSGDKLLARLQGLPSAGTPLVVLLHGLTGCADSLYLRNSARALLEQGYAVLRLNLRGALPGRKLARGHYHAGRSADLAAALRALEEALPGAMAGGLFLVGFSLGGNMLIKFLAEEGKGFPLRAAASVSAPIELKAAQQRLMQPRNRLYHRYLLARMKEEALATPGGLEEPYRGLLPTLKTVYDYDDRLVGPRNGFAGAEDYYARCSAKHVLAEVEAPLLAIHAADDPWIPAECYDLPVWRDNASLRLLLAEGGGHVGFHARDDRRPWHDRRILDFFGGF